MSVDTIANFLTSIRNAIMVSKRVVCVPHSKLSEAICKTLEREGFIHGYAVKDAESVGKKMDIDLKYVRGMSAIAGIKSVSTPGRRMYVGYENIKPVLRGLGISILSTSRGVMSNVEIKCLTTDGASVRIGGELLCNIW